MKRLSVLGAATALAFMFSSPAASATAPHAPSANTQSPAVAQRAPEANWFQKNQAFLQSAKSRSSLVREVTMSKDRTNRSRDGSSLAIAAGSRKDRPAVAADPAGGSISGTVTAATGGDLGGVCVDVTTSEGYGVASTATDSSGNYTIGGLAAGNYIVSFDGTGFCPGGIQQNILMQWWNGKTNQVEADQVTVTAGQDHGSIDAVMQPGGSISGTVTAAGGGGLGGICVSANPTGPSGFGGAFSSTDSNGGYTLTGLVTGDYQVQFSTGCGSSGNYASQWWDNQTSGETANPVSVTAGEDHGSIDAVMQPAGAISGTVTAAGGLPLSGICVTVALPDGYGLVNTATDLSGNYTLAGLAGGSYIVFFDSTGFCPGGTPSNYARQWWDNQPSQRSANPVTVTPGETHGSVDAVMQPGGSISGTVTAAGGGGLGGVCVNVSTPDGYGVANTATDFNGNYTIGGLSAGNYIVSFDGSGFCPEGAQQNVVMQWWDGKTNQSDADQVAVIAGEVHGSINAVMQQGGSISGTVTAAGGGGLGGICVNANPTGPSGFGGSGSSTDSNGDYTITGLAGGDYQVQFSAGCGNPDNYAAQWWENQPSGETANPVTVTPGETHGSINAVMQPGGSISGNVTAGGGGPLSGICVTVALPDGYGLVNTATDSNGDYTLGGLAAGNYIVVFDGTGFCPGGTPSNYATQWWDNQLSQETADPVTVVAGEVHGSINAVMQPGGSISGTVTAAVGGGLGGICVSANPTGPSGFGGSGTSTDSNGDYTITGLAGGDYQVQFSTGCGNPGNYATQWWDNQPSQETANPVSVTTGEDHSSIDAVMQPGGSISGNVTAAAGGPLAGVCVTVSLPDGFGINNTGTDSSGNYTLGGLAAGNYIVSFDGTGFCPGGIQQNVLMQWWNGRTNQGSADQVAVIAGADRGSVDAVMQPGGSISGTVTAAGGGGLGGICVSANPTGPSGFGGSGTSTDSNGDYTLTGLAGGDYHVQFSTGCGNPGNYATQWWDNQPNQETANAVSVTVGEDHGSIDAVMQPGGSISGNVTAVGGAPLAGICVTVSLPDGFGINNTATGPDGNYTIGGLAAGNYIVSFDGTGFCGYGGGIQQNVVMQWWNGRTNQGDADQVAVTAGEDHGSIDAVMQPGGSISGTVTASGGGALGGICVIANPTVPNGSGGVFTSTGPAGSYSLSGLAAGEYNVQFFIGCGNPGNYATQWWDNQPSGATANPVAVTAGADHGSIDAVMQPGGSISGTVTAAGGGALGGICVDVFLPGGSQVSSTATDPDGNYTLGGLATGNYIVSFDGTGYCGFGGGVPQNYATQWYNGQPTQASANLVSVAAGADHGSIDAAMLPPGMPGVPRSVSATAGSGKALVTWSAPTITGNGITGYDIRYRPTGSGTWSTQSVGSTATHAIVSGLTDGTQYEFQVRAVSTSAGLWSASTTATPAALAVHIVSATGGKNLITVTFTVTGGTWFNSAGSPVAHTQTCSVSGTSLSAACSSPATIDLVPGGTRTVTVATTDADEHPASATSASVKVTGSKNPKPPKH